ncbi:Rz1-like lysis system protein LysC [Adonisia turfae]
MKSVSLLLAAGVLAGCTTPEPVLVRPELPADLFVCAPPPPKPAAMTGADLANRSNAWAAAYDACQCQLMLVRHLIEGRTIEAREVCGPALSALDPGPGEAALEVPQPARRF